MTNVVIIGAGPSGLYLAIQLYHQGVTSILVCDPRAGAYVRPGHINAQVLRNAKHILPPLSPLSSKNIHIKDIERIFYRTAVVLGIRIENKHYLGFTQDKVEPGVLLEYDGISEHMPCRYVFDCTGTKRVLIHAVNSLYPKAPPFEVSPITSLVMVKHCVLAYVSVSPEDKERIKRSLNTTPVLSCLDSRASFALSCYEIALTLSKELRLQDGMLISLRSRVIQLRLFSQQDASSVLILDDDRGHSRSATPSSVITFFKAKTEEHTAGMTVRATSALHCLGL